MATILGSTPPSPPLSTESTPRPMIPPPPNAAASSPSRPKHQQQHNRTPSHGTEEARRGLLKLMMTRFSSTPLRDSSSSNNNNNSDPLMRHSLQANSNNNNNSNTAILLPHDALFSHDAALTVSEREYLSSLYNTGDANSIQSASAALSDEHVFPSHRGHLNRHNDDDSDDTTDEIFVDLGNDDDDDDDDNSLKSNGDDEPDSVNGETEPKPPNTATTLAAADSLEQSAGGGGAKQMRDSLLQQELFRAHDQKTENNNTAASLLHHQQQQQRIMHVLAHQPNSILATSFNEAETEPKEITSPPAAAAADSGLSQEPSMRVLLSSTPLTTTTMELEPTTQLNATPIPTNVDYTVDAALSVAVPDKQQQQLPKTSSLFSEEKKDGEINDKQDDDHLGLASSKDDAEVDKADLKAEDIASATAAAAMKDTPVVDSDAPTTTTTTMSVSAEDEYDSFQHYNHRRQTSKVPDPFEDISSWLDGGQGIEVTGEGVGNEEEEDDDEDDDINHSASDASRSGHPRQAAPFRILGTSADDISCHPHVLSPPLMESLLAFVPDYTTGTISTVASSSNDDKDPATTDPNVKSGSVPAIDCHQLQCPQDTTTLPTASAKILDPMLRLDTLMPVPASSYNFWLKYSLVRDGPSLWTFLRQVRASTLCFLAIETDEGHVFGAFTSQPWRLSKGWYGSKDTFLWKMRRSRLETAGKSIAERVCQESEIQVFPYRTGNAAVQYCSKKCLMLGQGEIIPSPRLHNPDKPLRPISKTGSKHYGFALHLDKDLTTGTTSSSETFGNPCLIDPHQRGARFSVSNIEVWTLTAHDTVAEAEQSELSSLFLDGGRDNAHRLNFMSILVPT